MEIKQARKRMEEVKGFYLHLAVYIIVNLFLIWVNLTQSNYLWFYWPLFGWGIGILIHGITVFILGNKWEEEKVKRIRKR